MRGDIFFRYAIDVFRRAGDASEAFTKENRGIYDGVSKSEKDLEGQLLAVDKDRSAFMVGLDVATSPSLGIVLSVVGALAAFTIPVVAPVAAASIVAGALFFGVLDVVFRAREIDRVAAIKHKRATIDTVLQQNGQLKELLNSINPELTNDAQFMDRLKLGIAREDTIKGHKDQKLKKAEVVKWALASEFPCAAFGIAFNIVVFNVVGLGMSAAAAILGTSGTVIGQVKHEKTVNDTQNYIATNAMMSLGISPEMANNSKFIEEISVIRRRQISVLSAIKESKMDLTVEQVKAIYVAGVKAANFKGALPPEEEKGIIENFAEVFFKGFDRRYVKNALEASRPDENIAFSERVAKCVSREEKQRIQQEVKKAVDVQKPVVQEEKEKPHVVETKRRTKSKKGSKYHKRLLDDKENVSPNAIGG